MPRVHRQVGRQRDGDLAPRLSDLKGKKVYVIPCFYHDQPQSTGAPRAILRALPKIIPGVEAIYPKKAFARGVSLLGAHSAGPTPEEDEDLKNADAVVVAVSW